MSIFTKIPFQGNYSSKFRFSGFFLVVLFFIASLQKFNSQTTLCVGSTAQMSYSGTGGSWISSNNSIATVNATGLVTGVSSGTASINYQTSSSAAAYLYWTFESGATNNGGGIFTYTPTTTSNSSALTGTITQTGSGTHENFSWASGSPGMVAVQRQNPAQYSYVQFTTSGSTTVNNVTFTKYHNNNSCCAGSSYQMKLQIQISGGAWTNVGSSFTCSNGTNGASINTTINTTVPAGTHKLRWVRESGSNGGDYFALNNVQLNCTASTTTNVNTNSVTVNPTPAQPSAITAPASICLGTSGTYSVTNVSGVTYNWTYSGTGTISGSGSSISLNPTTGGTLTVTPSNSCGAGTARTYTISLSALNAGAHNTTPLSMCDGGNPSALSFTTAASGGSTPYSYQWQLNNVNIASANTNSYDPPALTPGTYSYNCKVTDVCGNVAYTSPKVITVTADPDAPNAIKSPDVNEVCFGTTLSINTPSYGANNGQACGFEYAYSTNNGATWSTTSSTVPSFQAVSGSINKIRIRVVGGCASGCNASSWTEYSWNVSTPSTAVTPANGDFIWRGASNLDWNTPNNWFNFNGTSYTVATQAPQSNNNVIISQNQVCVLNQPTIDASAIGNAKNIVIESGATLTMTTGTLNVNGNFTNNGAFVAGTGTVAFTGTVTQKIDGASSSEFYNLTLNNNHSGVYPSHVALKLEQNTAISNELTLTDGILDVFDHVLTLGTTSSKATISPSLGTADSYIAAHHNTGHTGFVKQYVHGANIGTSYSFPIGDDAKWTPYNLTFNSGSLIASGSFIISHVNDALITGSNNSAFSNRVMRDWEVEPSAGITNPNYTIEIFHNQDVLEFGGTASSVTVPFKLSGGVLYAPNASGINSSSIVNLGTFTSAANSYTWTGLTSFSNFGGTEVVSVLPIELVSFQANCAGDNKINVTWTTASEHNASHYVVEHSRNGNEWQALTIVAAAGNSTSLLDYTYVHENPNAGTNYYRLTQYDNDGMFEQFNAVAADCDNMNSTTTLSTYPNPSEGSFYISLFTEDMEGEGVITVTDAKGTVVHTQDVTIQKGNTIFHMDNLNVAAGMYYIQVTNGNTSTDIVKHSLR